MLGVGNTHAVKTGALYLRITRKGTGLRDVEIKLCEKNVFYEFDFKSNETLLFSRSVEGQTFRLIKGSSTLIHYNCSAYDFS